MRVVYSEKHKRHHPRHEVQFGIPIAIYELPGRAESIRRALEADGGFSFDEPTEHGLDPIRAVHDEGLIAFLEEAWGAWERLGLGPELFPDTMLHPALRRGMGPSPEPRDSPVARAGYWTWETMSPIVEGTYEAARAAVDVALSAADIVLSGEGAAYGLCRPPGHHAPRAAYGGYCYFNNAAIVAESLVRQTGQRVAVLDVDFHHGNGTQQIFYERGDVLYISLHGHPDRAYPYFAGFADERGAGRGAGTTLNIPLPEGCADGEYLANLDLGLERIAAFGGGFLVVSLGMDTYKDDPICDFALTTPVYHEVGRRAAAASSRTVILQEGGYFIPQLGENVRQWLRGFEGRELDLEPSAPALS